MASTSDPHSNDKRLLARVQDTWDLAQRQGIPRFIGFLDERETAMVRSYVQRLGNAMCVRFFGGHEEAERTMLGVAATEEELEDDAFPLCSLDIRWRRGVTLSHRDVLGSLIGCGVTREKIGDILCEDGRAVAFVAQELVDFLADALDTVGREGVRVSTPAEEPFPVFHRYRSISSTIASARLDGVLKALLGGSREQACELIRKGAVQVNHTEQLSVSFTVKPTDLVSVRGHGRYVIDDVSDVTRKGRLVLRARQFV